MTERIHPINEQVEKRPESGKGKLLWKVAKRFPFYAPFLFVAATVASNAQSVEQDPTPSPTTITTAEGPITDQDGDGFITLVDARILTPPQTTNCPVCVDVNGNKVVDQTDIDLVNYQLEKNSVEDLNGNSYNASFDVNNDGANSETDVDIIKSYLGQEVTAPSFGVDDPSEITFGYDANTLLVKYKTGVNLDSKQALLAKYDLSYKSSLDNIDELEIKDGAIDTLKQQIEAEPEVDKVFKNFVAKPQTNDPGWINQWGAKKIRIEEAWFTETRGNWDNPVKVAVIDVGFDVDHNDLQLNLSNLRRNAEVTDEDDPDYENVSGNDENHGTATAGIIGATVDNFIGIAGLNHRVELIPIRVAGELGVRRALEWAMEQDVRVINISLCFGYSDPSEHLSNDTFTEARNEHGIVIVGIAGNDGRNDSCYPGNHPAVVSVGATKEDDSLWEGSSGRQDADIFAPGDCIEVLRAGGFSSACHSGTSFAAPHVSAVVALCETIAPISPDRRNDLRCDKFLARDTNGFGRIDAWSYLWYRNCSRFDNSDSGQVDVLDLQILAFRTYLPPIFYDRRYDVFPVGGDGKIDISDYYVEASRNDIRCQ